jgi:hypothetical protein
LCSGGLGITGGFVDVGCLYDCLYGIWTHQADDSILDLYSDVRRQKYKEIIDPISTENFKRVFDQDPEVAGEKDHFLVLCKKAAEDKDFAREMHLVRKQTPSTFTMHTDTHRHLLVSDMTSHNTTVRAEARGLLTLQNRTSVLSMLRRLHR